MKVYIHVYKYEFINNNVKIFKDYANKKVGEIQNKDIVIYLWTHQHKLIRIYTHTKYTISRYTLGCSLFQSYPNFIASMGFK